MFQGQCARELSSGLQERLCADSVLYWCREVWTHWDGAALSVEVTPSPVSTSPTLETGVSGQHGPGSAVKVSHSAMSNSLSPHGLKSARFLCSWDFPGKTTGVDCHFLLWGIFQTQRLNLCLLSLQLGRQILYH